MKVMHETVVTHNCHYHAVGLVFNGLGVFMKLVGLFLLLKNGTGVRRNDGYHEVVLILDVVSVFMKLLNLWLLKLASGDEE